jgi:hypothetical protein
MFNSLPIYYFFGTTVFLVSHFFFICGRFAFSLFVSFDIRNDACDGWIPLGRDSIHVSTEEYERVRTSTMNERTGISAVVSSIASWKNTKTKEGENTPQPRTQHRRPNNNTNGSISLVVV